MTLNILRPSSRWEFLRIAYGTLHLLHQFRQLGAQPFGFFILSIHYGVFQQCVQPLDFLNLSSIARKSEGGSFRLSVASPFVQPSTVSQGENLSTPLELATGNQHDKTQQTPLSVQLPTSPDQPANATRRI